MGSRDRTSPANTKQTPARDGWSINTADGSSCCSHPRSRTLQLNLSRTISSSRFAPSPAPVSSTAGSKRRTVSWRRRTLAEKPVPQAIHGCEALAQRWTRSIHEEHHAVRIETVASYSGASDVGQNNDLPDSGYLGRSLAGQRRGTRRHLLSTIPTIASVQYKRDECARQGPHCARNLVQVLSHRCCSSPILRVHNSVR